MANEAIKVFFSYSHRDEHLRNELANHLEILKLNHVIDDWHDRKILPGEEWDYKIKASLNSAQIILLLISSDFIASRYCRDTEVAHAMKRHEAGEACVIPVILRNCLWQSAPFGQLQALPKNAVPITDATTWPTRDDAFTDVAKGIQKTANSIRQRIQAEKRAQLEKYEAAYTQAIQQEYPLGGVAQDKLYRLQVTLNLSDTDIASVVTRLSAQYGEGRQKLKLYRDEVCLCLDEDDAKLSGLSRSILDGVRIQLGLTPEEATAVEQEALQPYQAKEKAVAQYQKVFTDTLGHENSPSERTRHRLKRFQKMLGLSDDEVQAIEAKLYRTMEQQEQERTDIEGRQRQKVQEDAERKLEETEVERRHQAEEANLFVPSQPPLVNRKELHECDPSKILFIKNVRDPNGGWAYTIDRIQEINSSVESRVFELFWLPTSRGAKSASNGGLMLLNQHAKVTHVVEMLDDEIRENKAGYFRWVRVVWMPAETDWSRLPHQRDILGFDPPTIGGGTAYAFANLSKFKETWSGLEVFQQHVFQSLTGAK